ncbi:hypothetical protein C0J45_7215, partial [Silurus meridionalis]
AAQGTLELIDNFDRPGKTYSDGVYTGTNTYANGFGDEPGKRIPKAGAVAEAGVGRAGAAWSVFSAEARGPNAAASAKAKGLEAGAIVGAELGSVSAVAGPVEAKLGLGVETGVSLGPAKLELKLLGTGFTLGNIIEVSFFGSKLTWKLF